MAEISRQTSATRSDSRRRGRGWRLIAIAAAVALLIYAVAPYYALWRFLGALKTGNTVELRNRVDFRDVRETMKKQLREHFFPRSPDDKAKKNRLNTMLAQMGPTLIDQLVEAYLTPDGLVALVANPRINAMSDRPTATATAGADLPSLPNASKVRYAFFTGPTDFLVDLNGTKLRFEFDAAGWRVHRVELDLNNAAQLR